MSEAFKYFERYDCSNVEDLVEEMFYTQFVEVYETDGGVITFTFVDNSVIIFKDDQLFLEEN